MSDEEKNPKPVTTHDFLLTDINNAKRQEELYQQFKKELENDPRIREFLSAYHPDSARQFIEHQAQYKVYLLRWSPSFITWQERDDLRWVNEALERMQEIQQKKLFDLQCQWRAEKITLPGVLVCMDFRFYESDVMNCSFLPPVTEDEIELYLQYLKSNNFEHEQGWMDSWQDYYGIKEAYDSDNENRNFPEWYDFYNGRKGTGVLMTLPDIRGPKEQRYIDLAREERKKTEKPFVREDDRPMLTEYRTNLLEWFIDTFEDKKTQEYYNVSWEKRDKERPEYYLEPDKISGDLRKTDELIPISGWFDWREAVTRTHAIYCQKKIAEALPAAFDQYQMMLQTGAGFAKEMSEGWKQNRQGWIDLILEGRQLCGEPRDLDF